MVETLTDNVELAPSDRKKSDLITQIVPAVRIDGTGGRLKVNLNYAMQNLLYAHDSTHNTAQHYLSSLATYEAVENWLFVDATANITQQAVSAFAPQPGTDGNVNNNRAQTFTYQVSPYVRGRFGSTSNYQARYRWVTTTSGGNNAADSSVEELIGNINGATGIAALGYAVDATAQRFHPDIGRDTESNRFAGSLRYQFYPELRGSVTAGRETNNYALTRQGYTTYGGGLEWAPTDRTQISAFREHRFFGQAHTYNFQHRMRRTAWRYTDRKDLTTLPNQLATTRGGVAYELLFNQLTSSFPDPIARGREVERILRQNGIPADLALAPQTFLTTSVYVQRAREASFTILGVTNTVTIAALLTDSQAATTGSALADDFARASAVHQRGITADWAHRLSPLSSLNLSVSQYRSTGDSAGDLQSTQSIARLSFSRQIGPKTFGSVSARTVRFDGPGAADYREKAVTVSLSLNF